MGEGQLRGARGRQRHEQSEGPLQHGIDEALRHRRQMKKMHGDRHRGEKQRPPHQRDKEANDLDVQDLGARLGEAPEPRGEKGLQPPA